LGRGLRRGTFVLGGEPFLEVGREGCQDLLVGQALQALLGGDSTFALYMCSIAL
jgi:hypothetical protein